MLQRLFANQRLLVAATLSVIFAGTLWAYSPGLSGEFIFDDLTNITQNTALKDGKLDQSSLAEIAFSRGGLLSSRPLSMLTFSVNHYFSGLRPYAYKATNLVIHLLNGLCVYVLTRLILGAYASRHDRRLTAAQLQTLSVVVCAAWLLHPINLTNVLYVVQRMNSLSALFTLLGLILYLRGRVSLAQGFGGKGMMVTGFAVFTPLAMLCKENGALLPLYAFVLEISLFRFQSGAPGGRRFTVLLFTVFLLLPLLGVLVSLIVDPGWLLGGYIGRPFTLMQRLLTEARALWFYLFLTFVPDIRDMGLFHDDFAVSHGLLTPLSTLPAVLGIVALAAAAYLCRQRAPLVTLGILFYLAGHSMESSIIPLELVFEHRNYLPVYGVLLPVFYYLAHPVARWNPFGLRHAAALLGVAAFTFATTVRASEWGSAVSFNLAEAAHHPHSPRANMELGRVFYGYVKQGIGPRKKNFTLARRYFSRATLADSNYAGGLFGLIILYSYMDRPLPHGVVAMLAYRLQHTPFANNDGNLLAQLLSCQEDGVCRLGRSTLGRIVHAAVLNKTLSPRTKAAVLTSASRYFGLYDEYPAALHFSREAARALPGELRYRLNVIYWLTTMGKLDEAQQTLDRLKAEDLFNRYAHDVTAQERRIRDARLLRTIGGDKARPPADGSGSHAAKPAPPPAENQ